MSEQQTTSHVLMVRPASFGSNPQTAASNVFQSREVGALHAELRARVAAEFEALAVALRAAGVDLLVIDDTPVPEKPDAAFPNNWVSFHADGTVVLYPMLADNRRLERRSDVLQALVQQHGFRIARTVDLTRHELEGVYLEGTGSLVLDRVNRHAFACLSPRTQLDALGDFAQQLDYEVIGFEAHDAGAAIYHTNVLMCIGSAFAVICAEAIADATHRESVLSILRSRHEVIEISRAQMNAFAGNMLELRGAEGTPVIAMSAAAHASLDDRQRAILSAHGKLVSSPIPTIERFGGGSVRCMLAEIHLPRRSPA